MIKKQLFIYCLLLLSIASCTTQKKVATGAKGVKENLSAKGAYNDFFKAEAARISGDKTEAIKLYKAYVAKYKNNATAYYNLSRLQFNNYTFKAAEVNAAASIALNDTNKYFLEHYADVLVFNEKTQDAIKIYKQLEKKFPYAADSYLTKQFRLYKEEKEYKNAIEALDGLEKSIGVTEEISMEKAKLYSLNKQKKESIREIEKLVEDDPNNIQFKTMLANIYEKNDESEKATELYKQLVDEAPDDPNLLLSLSNYYLKNKDTAAYKETIGKIASNADLDVNFKLAMIMPLISQRNDSAFVMKEAMPLVRKLKASSPEDETVDGLYADMLYFGMQYREAIPAFRKYLKSNKKEFSPWFKMMLSHSNLNELDSMVSVADEALVYFPNNALAHYFKGTGYYQLKNYDKAVKSLNEAIDVEPEQDLKAQIFSLLGDSYNSLKQYKQSDESFEKSLAIKEEATTLNNYAYYLSLRNERLDDALKMSKKSLELEPESLTFLDTYGWIFYKKGNYKEAKKYIEKAIDPTTGGDPDVLEHLGDIYFKLNNIEKAVEYWQQAKNKQGGSDLLDKKLRDRKLYE